MSGQPLTPAQRRAMAELMIFRLIDAVDLLSSDLAAISDGLRGDRPLFKDPGHVANWVDVVLSPLIRDDLLRLLTLMREGL
jgi:hypothetical protein